MAACGTSGLLGGRRVPAERDVVFPVADNSLIPAVPVFAFAVVFLEVVFFAVAFFATGFFVVVFLVLMILSPLFDFHFPGKCAIYDSSLFS
jgi:hypothetical protein